jgi:hypothetical protein
MTNTTTKAARRASRRIDGGAKALTYLKREARRSDRRAAKAACNGHRCRVHLCDAQDVS